jgi:hypothetical protein
MPEVTALLDGRKAYVGVDGFECHYKLPSETHVPGVPATVQTQDFG